MNTIDNSLIISKTHARGLSVHAFYPPFVWVFLFDSMPIIVRSKRREFNKIRHKIKHRIWKRDNYICFYCGKKVIDLGTIGDIAIENNWSWEKYTSTLKNLWGQSASLDHKIPLAKKGTNEENNLVCCCIKCNIKKGTKIYGNSKYYPNAKYNL